MKRLVLLATLLAFVFGMAASAHAVKVEASGAWAVEFLFSENFDMQKNGGAGDGQGDFNVYQRLRTQFDFIANENLKGVLATEIGSTSGEQRWGGSQYHFHDRFNGINVRRAYVDFAIPGTKITNRIGLQNINLPAAVGGGSMIMDDEMTGVVTAIPVIDEVSVVAGYARLYDFNNGVSGDQNSAFDAGVLILPVKLDGFEFAPFFMYGYAGDGAVRNMSINTNNSETWGLLGPTLGNAEGRRAYWGGTSFTMTYFDPIKVMADVNYGKVTGNLDADDRSGWMFDLAVDYTGFDFMTPELFFAYTSGEDSDVTDGSERMPTLNARNWALGSFFFGGDTLLQGSKGYGTEQTGFWAVGLSLKDISFLEKLSHTFTVMYAKGTNDKDMIAASILPAASGSIVYGQTLTEEDHIVEVDLNTKYQLYEELCLTLDLGYINNGYDKDKWRVADPNLDKNDAYKVSTGILYQF
ncbi:MAG TPA: outer membrane homotrimeric porin [Desulfovibrio sp.]|uniref:outer membrane homotrimeric porin n=1 Tax=Desulfovibrio sp. TaxID=885 RepID=UPI002BB6C1F4|nr:outer membrane homotrimeric porin [Desulfovibrio sp.]HMM37226.1 outer membrane homotrimeric porin [Desulfovibrio sp.]